MQRTLNRMLSSAALLCAFVTAAHASCGTATQTVTVSSAGKRPLSWTPRDDTPKRLDVAGAALGLAVAPSGRAAATRQGMRGQADGLLAIRLYDLGEAPPTLLAQAYGPPNSTHTFSAQGGVAALGDTVLTVRLINGGCR